MIIYIPGDPVGKERPRHTRNGHTYTPEKTKAYEAKVAACFLKAHGKRIDGPVFVAITAYMPIPKRATKADRAAMEAGTRLPMKRPDADNIAKIVMDALNGLAYHDDAQVIGLSVLKRYGDPHVEINIMGGDKLD